MTKLNLKITKSFGCLGVGFGAMVFALSWVKPISAEELRPIRYGQVTFRVYHFKDSSIESQAKDLSRLENDKSNLQAICTVGSEKVPLFETRKSPSNYYITPYMGKCAAIGSVKKNMMVYLGGVMALEKATALAEADQKTYMMNVSVVDAANNDIELKFDSNWIGVENLENGAVNLDIRMTLPASAGGDRFWIQARFNDPGVLP